MKVKNNPYWYKNTESTLTPMRDDNDLPILSGHAELSGTFLCPGLENVFYSGLDRLTELSSLTYKPNNPYAWGSLYVKTGDYIEVLSEECIAAGPLSYSNIYESMAEVYSRHGVAIDAQTFVPVSVKIAYNETLGREYFIEEHITPTRGYTAATGWYISCSFTSRIRSPASRHTAISARPPVIQPMSSLSPEEATTHSMYIFITGMIRRQESSYIRSGTQITH